MKNWTEHYVKQETIESSNSWSPEYSKLDVHKLSLVRKHVFLMGQYKGLGVVINHWKLKKLNDQITNHAEHFPEYYL